MCFGALSLLFTYVRVQGVAVVQTVGWTGGLFGKVCGGFRVRIGGWGEFLVRGGGFSVRIRGGLGNVLAGVGGVGKMRGVFLYTPWWGLLRFRC